MGVSNKLKKNREKNVYFYSNSAKISKYFARLEQECCSAAGNPHYPKTTKGIKVGEYTLHKKICIYIFSFNL